MSGLPQTRIANNPLVALALSLAVGIFVFQYFDRPRLAIVFGVAAAVLFSIAAALVLRGVSPIAIAFLLIAFVGTGYLLALVEARSVSPNRIVPMFERGELLSGEPVEVSGIIQGQPEAAPDGFYLTLRADCIRSKDGDHSALGEVLLLAHAGDQSLRSEYDALQLRHGARIRVMTVLDRDEDYRNPGVQPFTEYLDRQGYDATGVVKSPLLIERLDDERVFLPVAWLYEWRQHLEAEFDRRFSAETAGVLDAVLLGNRHKVSRAVADRFREGGTFHVLVIAGLHISFIAGLLFLLMKRITRNRVVQFVCLAIMLFAYSLAVGAQMPVIRAALVFTFGIFAPLVWRRANSLNVIAAAALVLLVSRPSDLFDPSFQLTFLSVISIVTLAVPIITRMQAVGTWRPAHETPYPPSGPAWFRSLSETIFWSERAWQTEMAASNVTYRLFKTGWADKLERWHLQRLLRFSIAAVIVSATVQIGMLPLLVIYFHRLSFASLLLNIFVGVAMAGLAFVALAATLLAQFSSAVAAPLIFLSEKIEWLMVHAIDPFNRFNTASIRLPHYHGWAASIYVLYFVCLSVIVVALFRWHPLRPAMITGAATFLRRSYLISLVAVFGLLLAVIIFHPLSAARADGKLHVDFLDVGQGDSALVTMPDGATLLIDGGGRPNIDWQTSDDVDTDKRFERDTRSIGERVVSEYLWARGLDHIDYILPTHADADHIDGLNDVARNFKVRGAIVSRTPADDAEYIRFAQTMKTASVSIERIGAGDILHFGEVAIDVLWPSPADNSDAPWRNNDGTVLRIRYGNQAFLFTADIEKEAERGIVNQGTDLRSNIVKVAHHGSRTSSTPDFIAATRASLAIISVGRTSIFGHPNKEVVDRWRATGAQMMTTGERGTISVVTDGKELKVSTFVN
ncbi:MAG TPA: ComEC/Rec2 family competence protein [Pyrinomonadaceae bacterium]